jgi:hypothetical protein
MNWKGCGRKQLWINFGSIPDFPGGTEKNRVVDVTCSYVTTLAVIQVV